VVFQRAVALEHGWWTSYVHELRHLLLLHAHGEFALLVLVEAVLWSDTFYIRVYRDGIPFHFVSV
jgi:hypothetical protein